MAQPSRLEGLGVSGCIKPRKNGELPSVRKAPDCLKRRYTISRGLTNRPPRIAPARGPPAWDDPPIDLGPDWEALAQPSPEYVFNQEMRW